MARKPTLALAQIIIRKQVSCAGVPASAQPIAQFQAHARVASNIADVPGFTPMLGHKPELVADASVTHGGAARLAGLAAYSFKQRVPWGRQPKRKQELNRHVEQVFLDHVNNAVFHFLSLELGNRLSQLKGAEDDFLQRRVAIVRALTTGNFYYEQVL